MSECEALPLDGKPHSGSVSEYFRVCPAGHLRSGFACESCAGIGAVLCNECGGDKPGIVIAAEIFQAITNAAESGRIEQLQNLAGAMLASFTMTSDGYRCRVGQVQIAKWTRILNGET
jgi:hypothetical protein